MPSALYQTAMPDAEKPRAAFMSARAALPAGDPRLQYCIGEGFAWMEGVLAIATIAQRWRLRYEGTTPPGVQAKITLRPDGPLPMQILSR